MFAPGGCVYAIRASGVATTHAFALRYETFVTTVASFVGRDAPEA